jgi:hypothetical protein
MTSNSARAVASSARRSIGGNDMAETDEMEWPLHSEALAAAPGNHRLLFGDDEVRVLEVTVEPGERENFHHHRWPSIMVVLARPNYRNFDAAGNEIPPSGERRLIRGCLGLCACPPQPMHAIEVAADAPHGFRGIRSEFKTSEAYKVVAGQSFPW